MNKVNRAMLGLRPGDIITGLYAGHENDKILVLARVGDDRYEFSMPHSKVNIVRDPNGPWRWNMHEQVFRNSEGRSHALVGLESQVLEAGDLRELGWYRKLPQPADVRFNIDANDIFGHFHEPALLAKMTAIMNRGTSDEEFAKSLQLAIDLIFGDRAEEVVDERSMRLLMALVNSAAQQVARNSQRHPLEELMAGLEGGISIMEFGPEGLAEMFRRSRRERRERREPREDDRSTERTPHRRGNDHDHSAHEHHGFPG